MSYIITLEDAAEMVECFINKYGDVAKNQALGGMISADSINGHLEIMEFYTGNMGWYCFNEELESPYPELFVAFEENSSYTKGQEVDRPETDKLTCPLKKSIFKYIDNEYKDVETLLKTHQLNVDEPVDQPISVDQVYNLKEKYRNHPRIGNLNDRPYGFFENENHEEVDRLVRQSKYLRYYFGFKKKSEDGDDRYEGSRIRLIIIGTDDKGLNRVDDGSYNARPAEERPIIIQKSWPPQ